MIFDSKTGESLMHVSGKAIEWDHSGNRIALFGDDSLDVIDATKGYQLATSNEYTRDRARRIVAAAERFREGRLGTAIEMLKTSLEQHPENLYAHSRLATAYSNHLKRSHSRCNESSTTRAKGGRTCTELATCPSYSRNCPVSRRELEGSGRFTRQFT